MAVAKRRIKFNKLNFKGRTQTEQCYFYYKLIAINKSVVKLTNRKIILMGIIKKEGV